MLKTWKTIISILFLTVLVVWFSAFSANNQNLKVISCNVGQGDATLIVYNSTEIIIDGGPNNDILNCVAKNIPFWDREIEVVILTHPQADHYTGLLPIFERYKVKNILANSLDAGTQTYTLLKKYVVEQGTRVYNPYQGMSIRSNLMQLDILHPSESFLAKNTSALSSNEGSKNSSNADTVIANTSTPLGVNFTKQSPANPVIANCYCCHCDPALREKQSSPHVGMYLIKKSPANPVIANTSAPLGVNFTKQSQQIKDSPGVLGASTSSLDPNEFSIVVLLKFASFKFLFTGDASTEILENVGTTLDERGYKSINYIKIPHHGSKYSVSEEFYADLAKNFEANDACVKSGASIGSESEEQNKRSLTNVLFDIRSYYDKIFDRKSCIQKQIATVSVGKNSYGHPSDMLIRNLSNNNFEIYRTDINGDIVIETDGKNIWKKNN